MIRSAGLMVRQVGWMVAATLAMGLVLPLGSASSAGPPRLPMPAAARVQAPVAHGKHLISGPHSEGMAQSVTDYTSNNWDGYFVTDASHTTDFRAISATWTVATVTCTSTAEEWAGFWVGMDGWWNDVVEQGGTEAICLNGSPQYSVWWEMFPFNDIQVGFSISPGDRIHASVTYNPGHREFDIVVRDLTSHQTLKENTQCETGQEGCPRTSADVISEDIEHFGGGLFPLPDYGTQADTSVRVTDTAGHTGPLSDPAWQLGKVTEVSSGVTKQTTSGLSHHGTSFTTTWQHE